MTSVHSAVAGRIRVAVPYLYRNDALKNGLENALIGVDGIARASANTLTGRVLVHYETRITADTVLALIEQQMRRLVGRRDTAGRYRRRKARPTNVIPIAEYLRSKTSVTTIAEYLRRQADVAHFVHARSTRQAPTPQPATPQRETGETWHCRGVDDVLGRLDSHARHGLALDTAAQRLAQHGANALPRPERRADLSILAEQFLTLPVGLLGASAVVSVATGGLVDAAVILAVVLVNAAIGFLTERQAERTIRSLTDTTVRSAAVVRGGNHIHIPVEDVVPGDVLVLAPGVHVAADARVIAADRLSVDESALTGESMPATKSPAKLDDPNTPLADRTNMVYMGTIVTGGSGVAVVTATGMRSEIGAIQALAGAARPPETPMQRQLGQMGGQLAVLSSVVCAGVFAVGLLRGQGWLQMLTTSISLAVAAVPEGLPAVATTTLALGIRDMRRRNVAVRHLDAVETLGAVQVFCLDKTGTLTLNRMMVMRACAGPLRLRVAEDGFFTGDERLDPRTSEELQRLLQIAALCNDSELAFEEGEPVYTGSPTENALLELAHRGGVDIPALRRAHPRHAVEYRAEGRHYMTTVHKVRGGYLLAVKGSPQQVLSMCRWQQRGNRRRQLNQAERGAILVENERMAGDALRVLGLAYGRERSLGETGGADLVWLGLAGLADPIRPGMSELMREFHGAGIRTVMITGDQAGTAYAIGKELGLSADQPLEIMESSQLATMDPELLAGLVQRTHVFARVSPAHKLEIVQALQRAGNVVAMTGDGINDGPALKAANIGVAMGAAGTDAARSVSDVVLQDDNLHTMAVAVREGRAIYGNIRKAIHYLLSTNFSEIEVMLIAIAVGAISPLNPMQLLWINLITDVFPGLGLALEAPEPDVMDHPPRRTEDTIVSRDDLKRLGLQSAVITTGALTSYGYGLLRYGVGPQASTQAFMTLTLAQLFHALGARSEAHSIFDPGRLPANPQLNAGVAASILTQFAAPLIPGLRRLLGIAPIGVVDTAVITATSLGPMLINSVIKKARRDRLETQDTDFAEGGDYL